MSKAAAGTAAVAIVTTGILVSIAYRYLRPKQPPSETGQKTRKRKNSDPVGTEDTNMGAIFSSSTQEVGHIPQP